MFYSRAANAGRETRKLKCVWQLSAWLCVSVTDAEEASREELDMDSAEDHSGSKQPGVGGTDEYAAFL